MAMQKSYTMIFSMTLALFALLIFLLPPEGVASLIDCGSAFPIYHLAVDPPSAVAANQRVHMHGSFYVPETVRNGTVHTVVSMNFVTVFESTENLCSHVACPLQVGHQTLNRTTTFLPALWGRVYTTIQFYDQVKRPFLCLQYNVYATGSATNHTG
jgi:hypothetical protein